MDKMEQLYDILCEELEKITAKGELTAGSLEAVDKIVDIMKDMEEMGYSGDDMGSYRGSYEGSYERGGRSRNSYERGGRSYRGSYGRGSYAQRRDSRGRYSSNYSRHDIVEQLEDIMEQAPNEQSRREIERLIMKMEQM